MPLARAPGPGNLRKASGEAGLGAVGPLPPPPGSAAPTPSPQKPRPHQNWLEIRSRLGVKARVPRYYFNVCCDDFEETDLVGETCANDVEALKQALSAASTIIKDQLFRNKVTDGFIEVEDETHREVLRLPIRAAAY